MLGIEKRVSTSAIHWSKRFAKKSASIMPPISNEAPRRTPPASLSGTMILRDVADILANERRNRPRTRQVREGRCAIDDPSRVLVENRGAGPP